MHRLYAGEDPLETTFQTLTIILPSIIISWQNCVIRFFQSVKGVHIQAHAWA